MRVLILVINLVILHDVSAQDVDSLLGLWRVDYESTVNSMNEDERNKFNSLPERTRENIKASFDQREFNFEHNNSVTVTWTTSKGESRVKGKWEIEGKELRISHDNKTTRKYLFEWTESGDLILTQANDGGGIFKKLYLKK